MVNDMTCHFLINLQKKDTKNVIYIYNNFDILSYMMNVFFMSVLSFIVIFLGA